MSGVEWPPNIQQHIDRVHSGDSYEYLREAMRIGSQAQNWDLILAESNYLPQFAEYARNLVIHRLGYPPSAGLSTGPELFIRHAAFRNFYDAFYTTDKFHEEVDMHVRTIRNADMKLNIELFRPYTAEDYHLYETHLPQYKELVREKVCRALKYSPDIEYSIRPELHFRDLLSHFDDYNRSLVTSADYRTVNFIAYREHYMKSGMEAADTSQLVGLPWTI